MKVLKIILHSKLLFIILLMITLIYTTIFNMTVKKSINQKGEITIVGIVIKKRFTADHLTFTLNNNKTLPLTYYIKNKKTLKEYKKIYKLLVNLEVFIILFYYLICYTYIRRTN